MYCASFGFLIGQFIFADVFYIELVDCNGTPILNDLEQLIHVTDLNNLTNAVINTNFSNIVQNITTAAYVFWQLFQIMTGAYIFNLMLLLCVPPVVVGAFIILYIILLMRSVIAYVRGV